jgi:hypothetical protein
MKSKNAASAFGAHPGAAFFALLLAWAPHPVAARAAAPKLVDVLAKPFLASTMLQADEIWRPRLDELVQNATAAASLGEAWNAKNPGWRQARTSLGARVDRIFDAYRRSSLLRDELEERLSAQLTTAEMQELSAALAGPAGPTILRQQLEIEFVSSASMDEALPPPSDPRFQERIKELRALFAAKLANEMPADDPAHQAEATAFLRSPLRSKLNQILVFVGDRALNTLSTQIQLMLFDDQQAIGRDLEAAVATARRKS